MMETQELVVPKSIPMTSPASSDFHLMLPANLDENAAANGTVVVADDFAVAAVAALRRRNADVVAVNIVVLLVVVVVVLFLLYTLLLRVSLFTILHYLPLVVVRLVVSSSAGNIGSTK